ncbi:hypothetical protein BMW23_0344 [Bodo saltans virus]|uniref:Uncharacterized protein n=1 Tax=Bodo saltans virus TaxID=2024608 RepID=A0A2H4UU83_9VIRU|nr:hypothetical protein QJ851_gp0336 [Bodo saltans virus]ATZ80399.1 hypothetical protein BMW23_0344 [Bodo saltans virus]
MSFPQSHHVYFYHDLVDKSLNDDYSIFLNFTNFLIFFHNYLHYFIFNFFSLNNHHLFRVLPAIKQHSRTHFDLP